MKEAWVLRARYYKEDGQSVYYGNEDLTTDLQDALLIYDKEKFLEIAYDHERAIKKRFGEGAICNAGYTNITTNFEFAEVELRKAEESE